MCPWVGPHAPSFGGQLWGLPSRVEYLSPEVVLLRLVYGTTASPLWLELRGLSAWQATPSWTVHRLACQRLPPLLQVAFATVPDAAWPGLDERPWGTAPAAGPVGWLGRPSAPDPLGVGSFLSLGRPTCARLCGVLAAWLLFTGVPTRCVALRVRCPGRLGSSSRVCPLGVLPVCAVSWATWLLFTGVSAWCIVLLVRCPGPLGSCSPVCPLGALFCLCGVLGHLAPVHRGARLVRCFACAVFPATRLQFTGVPARHVVLLVRCPGPLCSCSPVCLLGALLCLCGVLGHLAPVQRCAHPVCCLCVRCPGPLGFCSPVCPLGVRCCVCGVLGHMAPVHQCARSVCCVACAVSWATWLLFTCVPARCVALRVRCPGPLGSCSPVCLLGVLFCLCGVLGYLAPVHR